MNLNVHFVRKSVDTSLDAMTPKEDRLLTLINKLDKNLTSQLLALIEKYHPELDQPAEEPLSSTDKEHPSCLREP